MNKLFGKLERKLALEVAKQLTYTAKDAQESIITRLPSQFTIRNRRAEKGVRIRAATPRKLKSKVVFLDRWMAQHEEPFVKTGLDDKSVSVPVGIRETPKQTTPPSKWPSRLLKKKQFYISTLASGNKAVFKRVGKSRKLMYVFAESVVVDQGRLEAGKTVERVVTNTLPNRLRLAMVKAGK